MEQQNDWRSRMHREQNQPKGSPPFNFSLVQLERHRLQNVFVCFFVSTPILLPAA